MSRSRSRSRSQLAHPLFVTPSSATALLFIEDLATAIKSHMGVPLTIDSKEMVMRLMRVLFLLLSDAEREERLAGMGVHGFHFRGESYGGCLYTGDILSMTWKDLTEKTPSWSGRSEINAGSTGEVPLDGTPLAISPVDLQLAMTVLLSAGIELH